MGLTDGGDEFRQLEINNFVQEYVRLAMFGRLGNANMEQVQVEWCLDTQLTPITIKPTLIGRVLVSLTHNAVDALKARKNWDNGESPVIRIATRRVEDGLEILLTDNGEGIPEEHLASIYTPFFTTRNDAAHVGLGLSNCYDIVVREHGGELRHERKDQGACFIIRLNWHPEDQPGATLNHAEEEDRTT